MTVEITLREKHCASFFLRAPFFFFAREIYYTHSSSHVSASLFSEQRTFFTAAPLIAFTQSIDDGRIVRRRGQKCAKSLFCTRTSGTAESTTVYDKASRCAAARRAAWLVGPPTLTSAFHLQERRVAAFPREPERKRASFSRRVPRRTEADEHRSFTSPVFLSISNSVVSWVE